MYDGFNAKSALKAHGFVRSAFAKSRGVLHTEASLSANIS